jgi:hypothetical protein
MNVPLFGLIILIGRTGEPLLGKLVEYLGQALAFGARSGFKSPLALRRKAPTMHFRFGYALQCSANS